MVKINPTHPFPAEKIQVIHVAGNDYEIGFQHATQVGEGAVEGMGKFYYELWKRMSDSKPQEPLRRYLFQAIKYCLDPVLIRYLARQVPQSMMDRLQGIAQVTHKEMDILVTALVLPDLLPILQTFAANLLPSGFVRVMAPQFGCSSFVHRGSRFLHGRNLDFPGVSYWDRFPVIQCTSPKKGLRNIGFTTAGIPFGGITGVNEAQISVSLHQHYCKRATLNGGLPFIAGERILTEAKSLDDALAILKNFRVASSWAFIVCDGKSRQAFIYETHPHATGIRYLGPETSVMAHTNYFQTPECQPSEYAATARMNWDNYARKSRLEGLVKSAGYDLEMPSAVKYLSDHFDPYWGEEKVYNRTVSQVYNIESLVLDLENMTVLMAEGNSPIHLRAYTEFDLGEIFSGKEGRTGKSVEAFRFEEKKKELAKEAYIFSFVAAMDGELEKASESLDQSLEYDFGPEVALTASVVSLKLGTIDRAMALLQKARQVVEDKAKSLHKMGFPPEYFEILLFEARVQDLKGNRALAQRLYRAIVSNSSLEDSNLRRLATHPHPYTAEKLSRILTPYSTYIPFQ